MCVMFRVQSLGPSSLCLCTTSLPLAQRKAETEFQGAEDEAVQLIQGPTSHIFPGEFPDVLGNQHGSLAFET